MNDTFSTVTLIKHYGWHARDIEGKNDLAIQLLQVALKMAEEKLPEQTELHRQLRRDIASLNHILGQSEDAINEFKKINYDFYAGDIYLEQGQFEKALEIYKQFHTVGPFKIHWRLWRCSFLLGRFRDVLAYIEDYNSESPQRVVTDLEIRALSVAAVNVYGDLTNHPEWIDFKSNFPKCANLLTSKIGKPEAIIILTKRWMTTPGSEKLHKRLVGKSNKNVTKVSQNLTSTEFEIILKKAFDGIWDIIDVEVITATTILKSLATSKEKLTGQIVIEHMTKRFIHPVILETHKTSLSQIIDLKLVEFEKTQGTDLVSMYRERILGSFGFYEANEVSMAIKTILLAAESDVRAANGLPPRGEGWLSESEMVRLLIQKFAPHKVIRQHSPDWLQGMKFDAYIADFHLAIEYQGEQHFKPIDLFGGAEGFSQTVVRDQSKRNLAEQNGTILEYIAYDQNIDQETTRLARKYLFNQ